MVVRSYDDEMQYVERVNDHCWRIKKGFQPNMNVEGVFYVNSHLEKLMFEELRNACRPGMVGGFLPGMKQIANVAALPGIVGRSVGLPDVHSGYGFAIGNMAAFDMEDPTAIVSPGGVGFDINCGVRLLRTNLFEKDVQPVKEQLAQSLFDHIPVGVGSKGIIPMTARDLDEALEMGMDWSLREGYVWAEDKEHCEEYGRMLNADPSVVSTRAKKRGLPQLGTLGAGNHYAEIQVVDEIYDKFAASKMGIEGKGQVVLMIHCGSRGFGHQVATDALVAMEKAMKRDKIETNDRQLACARINSKEGQDYLNGMAAAANFAWVNRSSMTFLARQAFSKMFHTTPDDLDMHVIYDVSHNIAKMEEHIVNGKRKRLLVHRKGSTRAFPPHHPLIPVDYQLTGQPVLIGGTMGTCSYVLTGTEKGMEETFGSTCHGAGRALSRAKSRRNIGFQDVLDKLSNQGISVRVASPKLVMEEAPESYKNVTDVVDTCHAAGISKKTMKLRCNVEEGLRILCATGDTIAQTLVERKKLSEFDPSRTTKFFILGSCVVAPVIRTWYLALERIVKFPGAKGALTKMCMDQGLFAPCFIVIFTTSAYTLNGGKPQNLKSHLESMYLDVLFSNWKLWPAAQILNFYFVPLQHRLLMMNLVAVIWNTYLAWKTNQTKPVQE